MTLWPSAVLDASQSCALDSQQDRIVVGIRLREDVAGKREAIPEALVHALGDVTERAAFDDAVSAVLALFDVT